MKTIFKTIVLLPFFIVSCSNDDTVVDGGNNGDPNEIVTTPGQVSKEDFKTFEGEIGIVLDARPLARKGYNPTQVTINVGANNGDYTQTVDLDEHSYMAQLSVLLEDLSEAQKEELVSGVQITPEYKDENGNTIFQEASSTVSFQSNPTPRVANANSLDETTENQTLNFRSGMSYYVQRVNNDGSPGSSSFSTTTHPALDDVITAIDANFNGNEPARSFTFFPIAGEPNTFAIRHTQSLRYLRYITVRTNTVNYKGDHWSLQLSPHTNLSAIQASTLSDYYKFKIERRRDGSFIIKNIIDDRTLKQVGGFGLTFADKIYNEIARTWVTAEERTWRIVSTSIEWNVSNIGTSFLDPILPPAETAFTVNSTLTNCGNGSLSQSVGTDVVETRLRTVGWEETLSMSTTNTVGVTASLDVEFSATLFGTGTTVNAGLETSYEHSWTATQTNSNWNSYTDDSQQTLFAKRTVTVPSGSASLVYDVFQFYPETKVNFVQRMRIEGTDSGTGTPLTGEQIRSMFYLSNFNGVITDVEATSIVVTLKGTVTLDKIVETESKVQDTPANCD